MIASNKYKLNQNLQGNKITKNLLDLIDTELSQKCEWFSYKNFII